MIKSAAKDGDGKTDTKKRISDKKSAGSVLRWKSKCV